MLPNQNKIRQTLTKPSTSINGVELSGLSSELIIQLQAQFSSLQKRLEKFEGCRDALANLLEAVENDFLIVAVSSDTTAAELAAHAALDAL
jgi:hypothetical protein